MRRPACHLLRPALLQLRDGSTFPVHRGRLQRLFFADRFTSEFITGALDLWEASSPGCSQLRRTALVRLAVGAANYPLRWLVLDIASGCSPATELGRQSRVPRTGFGVPRDPRRSESTTYIYPDLLYIAVHAFRRIKSESPALGAEEEPFNPRID